MSSRYILLIVPSVKTEFGKSAFIYSASTVWNEICRSLKLTAFISINVNQVISQPHIQNRLHLFLTFNLFFMYLCAAPLARAHL